ncbi:MAG: Gfo/Idh/MocA family protein [Rhodoglobus sp.]
MINQQRHRVALIGAGLIAQQVHLPRLAARVDVDVVAIVDADPDRAAQVAAAFGVQRSTTDFDCVLADDSIDVIDLCTPPLMHATQVCAAIAADKHVLLEKPLATTRADSITVARAATESTRTVMVAENWVFSSSARAVKGYLDSGELGDAFLWTSRHESNHRLQAGGQPSWNYALEESGGGYLMQAGTHMITLGRHLFGDVATVSAKSPQAGGDGAAFLDHDMVVSLDFTSGMIGSLVLTGRSHRTGQRILSQSIFGTQGTVDADILSGSVSRNGIDATPAVRVSPGYDEELDHFFDCVKTGAAPLTSAADQAETIRTALAIYRSATTKTVVGVEDIL